MRSKSVYGGAPYTHGRLCDRQAHTGDSGRWLFESRLERVMVSSEPRRYRIERIVVGGGIVVVRSVHSLRLAVEVVREARQGLPANARVLLRDSYHHDREVEVS